MSALIPFFVVLLVVGAAYLKIGLVLAVLRQALGGGAIPPAGVTAALALLLSAVLMAPVAERSLRAMGGGEKDAAGQLGAGLQPLREFLLRNAPARERAAALELAQRVRPPEERAQVSERDLLVVAPAFALAELKLACQIGFLLLLPFLVLDLLVASLLAGLTLAGLPPRAVALPFKLLLFVLCDGWQLLARGLLLGYA